MPLEQFNGDTFVAFIDIAGFTSMMLERDGRRAITALDDFYSVGYGVLRRQHPGQPTVDGLFVSDCGILFVRGDEHQVEDRLSRMLGVIESIHRQCSERAVFLTTSIAWGAFSYQQRIEFPGIAKNPVYGNAYIRAFFDNSNAKPRIYSGECRIVRKDLPAIVDRYCESDQAGFPERIRSEAKHHYFEWTRPNRG